MIKVRIYWVALNPVGLVFSEAGFVLVVSQIVVDQGEVDNTWMLPISEIGTTSIPELFLSQRIQQ